MSDFHVFDHGSVWLLVPRTDNAIAWTRANLPPDAPRLGAAFGIEARFVAPILGAIWAEGMTVAELC